MMRKVKWNGIFEELANVIGSEEYNIQFFGSNVAMDVLAEECPDSVTLNNNEVTKATPHNKQKQKAPLKAPPKFLCKYKSNLKSKA